MVENRIFSIKIETIFKFMYGKWIKNLLLHDYAYNGQF